MEKESEDSPIMAEIRGALSRGYTHKENKTKILDPTLIEAMIDELACSSIQFSMNATIIQN